MKRFFRSVGGKAVCYAVCILSIILLVASIFSAVFFVNEDFYTKSKTQIIEEVQYNEFYNDAYNLIYYTVARDKYDRFEINIHYSEEATNLRYRVISPEGKIIQSNTEEESFEYSYFYNVIDNGVYYNHYLLGVNLEAVNEENVYRVELFLEEGLPVKDKYSTLTNAYSFGYYMRYLVFVIAIASFALFVWGLVMLIVTAAHRPETEELCLNKLDKLPFDVLLILILLILGGINYVCIDLLWNINFFAEIALPILLAFMALLSFLVLTQTISARIKTETIIQNNLLYKTIRIILKIARKILAKLKELILNIPLVWKTALIVGFVIVFDLITIVSATNAVETAIILLVIKCLTFVPFVLYTALTMRKLQKAGKEIASGNLNFKVSSNEMIADFKKHGENLNSISDGLNIALKERLQSERTKTELITNVSHDIKTPLTSIINYASLISESEPLTETQKEYAEVLIKKSGQLKRLLDDLVEVSKATTGALEVSPERCEAGVLLSQIAGEFNDQIEAANLELVLSSPEEGLFIMVDSRRIWRVFENLMNNACKYSLPGSRIYLSASKAENEVLFIIKNTSKTPLNILPEELKERFVRGETSRTTEGTGLGLSIAESLTELQGGKMEINIDGDLFKVTLRFPDKA